MAEKYDLTQTLLPYLDRHLGLPLLSHLAGSGIFSETDIAKAQYELAKNTSMVDYALQLHEQAYPNQPAPAEIEKQRENAIALNDKLGSEVDLVLNVIQDPSVASALKQDKTQNLQWLEEKYNLTSEQINALYRYGYFQFNCGNYGDASSYLYHFRVLSTDPVLTMSSHWGKLASDILVGEWEQALAELKLLREQIDSSAAHATASYAQPSTSNGTAHNNDDLTQEGLLKKRAWLLHWALFIFFNHPAGREQLVEMFLSPVYLNTIQTTCWWLLRYVVAALLLSRRTTRVYLVQQPAPATLMASASGANVSKLSPQQAIKDIVNIIDSESYRLAGTDPIVDFLSKLFVDFDFEAAQEQLALAEQVASKDFFLADFKDELVEACRVVVSEAYCRIHSKVDIADLVKRLNLSKEDGEKWIVNLVRDTRADAKIDFKEGMVFMNPTHPPIYQTIIEKTRGFTFRTSAMGTAIDRKAHPPSLNNTHNLNGNDKRGGPGGRGGRGGQRNQGGQRHGNSNSNNSESKRDGESAPAAEAQQQQQPSAQPVAAN
ncbi:related to eukaryotic initiation factor 3e subunit [Sporisorium reilianum f. sp. reilianum]|uniref:Eukaryotic translation initiation factor 3 subunit E n=1 Tax=Sporisorium reilianum f. sp. reilianum TaxID=72559 RepID=A0A2N8U6Q8_9BASI|nr:related to eukaryotic initiation factor 3e subunit [Sporisorium reilianum f. sp. reilianum]